MHKQTKEVDVTKEKNPGEESSRRSFFKRAAAAVGVVAAAGYTVKLISGSAASTDGACEKYAADVEAQAKAVKANHLVVMTDEEKKRRLDELLNFHNQEIA